MFKVWKFLSVCILVLLSLVVQAKQVRVDSLRYKTAPDHSRVIFDVSSAVRYKILRLNKPERVVIDLKNTKLLKRLAQPAANHPLFKRIRSAARNKKNLRVVIDLKDGVTSKSFTLKPAKTKGHRLVVDLFANNKKVTFANKKIKPSPTLKRKKAVNKAIRKPSRDIIIAVDAGHGGSDPGALGKGGSKEKDVVLQIAKKLATQINKKKGMKAVLVRDKDELIDLRKRMEIARSKNADLFVSIHADAFDNAKAKGASVFTLSSKAAIKEAKKNWLGKNKRYSDLVGGVKLADKEAVVASVLVDLSQKATEDVSRKIAKKVLKQFDNIGHLHSHSVKKQGFMVLKAPDIPSILVETAFISNPSEEKKLKSHRHQIKMANAIFKGIVGYYRENPPRETYFAMKQNANTVASVKQKRKSRLKTNKKHVIARGDTLSEIAALYGVSMRSIKSANSLGGTRIKTGQILIIPRG